MKKKKVPFPNNKRREPPEERKKRQKKEKKKHFFWTERLTGRSVRLCVSVRVRRLRRSPLVRYKLAIGGEYGGSFSLFVFLLVLRGGKKGGGQGGEKMMMMVSQAADVSPLVWL